VPYSANWSSPWRAFSPRTWDTNADHWQEPADEPVLAPYIERFAYYISDSSESEMFCQKAKKKPTLFV
jgi:hypothetical protein